MAEVHQLIPQSTLDGFNVSQDKKGNLANLEAFGGANHIFEVLNVNQEVGLTNADVEKLREMYGKNEFPAQEMTSFFESLVDALSDTTLLILLAAAIVSLAIGAYQEPSTGWIEGVAILIAVFLVANITAGNDYTKELQFRALEASAQRDERASVLRNGVIDRINPADIVVGDVLVLQAGDAIPADCIIFDNSTLKANESSLTGEPDELKKSRLLVDSQA